MKPKGVTASGPTGKSKPTPDWSWSQEYVALEGVSLSILLSVSSIPALPSFYTQALWWLISCPSLVITVGNGVEK